MAVGVVNVHWFGAPAVACVQVGGGHVVRCYMAERLVCDGWPVMAYTMMPVHGFCKHTSVMVLQN